MELLRRLADKTLTENELLREVKQNFDLLSQVFGGVSSPKAAIRYGCAKVLRDLSEKFPERLYPHFDFFVNLLDGKCRILTWNALAIIANLTRLTGTGSLMLFLTGTMIFLMITLVTMANVVGHSGKIALAELHLAQKIADRLLGVESIPTTPHLIEECRRVITEKALESFDLFFDRIDAREKVIPFARRQFDNPRKL
jgi:hypothetical protein